MLMRLYTMYAQRPHPATFTFGGSRSNKDKEKQGRLAVVIKAVADSSDSSTSLSVFKSVQNVWETPEDRIAVIGFGLAAVIAFWASTNFVSAIDKLPLIPGFFEFVGILYSSWFVYRYLLFKPDREELVRNISKWLSDILGQ